MTAALNASGRMRGGFTLLELLVVIAVVAVLVGVLLPALSGARASARAIECGSAVRQLMIANDLYAQDHDDRYMPAAPEIETRNLERWHGRRATASEAFNDERGPISGYLDGPAGERIRACPEFRSAMRELSQRGRGFERGCGGYGYNHAFVGAERHEVAPGVWEVRTDRHGARRSRFRGPTATVAFADAALASDEVIEYSFLEPAVWPQWPEFRPDPSTHFRHAGKAGVVWLDGHVSAEPMTHSEHSGIYPLDPASAHIGWMGETSDNRLYDYH